MRASIIIAAHNEGQALWKTIRSCVESVGKLDHEILIADDASDDGSVEEGLRRFPHLSVHRHAGRQGASPTKHSGATNARGEVLVFLDGHCNPEPGAIERLVEDVERLDGQSIVTPTILGLDTTRWKNKEWQVGHGYRLELDTFDCGWLPLTSLRRVRLAGREFYESPAAIGCAFAVHRELYDDLRGFDPHMRIWGVEDLDFSLKCWLMGHSILHDPEARIGHRFRDKFDNYDVPVECILANKLRMAYKNFTHGVWSEWLERCRQEHSGGLKEHPEGLWACAWNLFEADRASAEQERAYLLAGRPRDEFCYANRFSLRWPQLKPLHGTPAARDFVALQAQGSEEPNGSPAPSSRRTVLLLGYWPPTDIGVDARHGMLWKYKERKTVTHDGKTYDVLAVSTTFAAQLGTFPAPAFNDEYWGKGSAQGDAFTVDYRNTSDKFWPLVKKHRPIAIMSFSRWKRNKEWALDAWGTNWRRTTWVITLGPWKNVNGVIQPQHNWERPYIGGSNVDPAPPSVGRTPIAGSPPDPTKAADTRRNSNLPMAAMKAAIDAEFTDSEVKPFINDTEGPGKFVSNFLAYHVAWYREWWDAENSDPMLACLRSGHTHVGGLVTAQNASDALEIQLKELFKVLPATD